MLFKTRIEIIPQRILEKKDRPKFNIRCVPSMKKKGKTDLGVPSMFEGQKKIPMARKMRKKKKTPKKYMDIAKKKKAKKKDRKKKIGKKKIFFFSIGYE